MSRQRLILIWLFWLAALVAATLLMLQARGSIAQVHVVLVYLLVVLGASASGGRALGVSLACVCYVLIDYYFQMPYGELANNKPQDWMALIAFLVTSFVSTQLLARAQAEAEKAQRRTVEVASLAKLGSETLSA